MKIYIDFDSTIVDSVKAFVSRYNQLYNKKEDPNSVVKYNFENLNLSKEDIVLGFNSNFFFSELDLYPEAQDALYKLKHSGAELVLLTRGTPTNIVKKIEWLDKHHWIRELFDDFVFTTSNQDKIKIDMSNAILIDDYRLNHLNSNAKYRYAFKDIPQRTWFPIPDDGVKIMNSWALIADDICKLLCKSTSTSVKKNTQKSNNTNNNSKTKKKNTRSNSLNNKKNNIKQKVVIK